MILIADSGSTKTHWALLRPDNTVVMFTTPGLNPHHCDEKMFRDVLTETFGFCKDTVTKVFFYGSGCSATAQAAFVNRCLHDYFAAAAVEVENDVVAAARALLGEAEGYISIVGTGSMCAHYNGRHLTRISPSLGYMVDDEGSGAQLGKELLKAYFYNLLPEKLTKAFAENYNLQRDDVLRNLYHQARPNAYLASFVPFLKANLHDETMAAMVFKCFDRFFACHSQLIFTNKNLPSAFAGSVAFYFRDILTDAASKHGMKIYDIQKEPIVALVEFHRGV